MSEETERPNKAYIRGDITYLHYEKQPNEQESFMVFVLPEHGCPLCGMMFCVCELEAGYREEEAV